MIMTQTNKVEIYKGTVSRDGLSTKSIIEGLWFAPTVWFFADHINADVGSLALKKSPFVCCITTACNTFTHRRQTASQNILLQKTPLPSDLNFDVCSQKRGSDPENLQNLAKVRDREIFARSAIFSKLFTSLASRHLPQYLLRFVAKLTISSSDFAPVALLWPLKPWLKILFFWGIKSCTWHSPPPWSVSLGFLTSLGGRCSRPDHLTRCWSVEQS